MATEIQENAPIGDQQSKPGRQPGECLQPSLEDYQSYQNQNKPGSKSSETAPKNEQAKGSLNGTLEITPIFSKTAQQLKAGEAAEDIHSERAQDNNNPDTIERGQKETSGQQEDITDEIENVSDEQQKIGNTEQEVKSEEQEIKGKQSDAKDEKGEILDKQPEVKDKQKDVKDGQDVVLSPEVQQSKDKFLAVLRDRFKDDPKMLQALEKRLDRMDKRVLNEHVEREEGADNSKDFDKGDAEIDQQKQLSLEYEGLNRIAKDAEKLTFTDKAGQTQKVYDQPWMVNAILAGNIIGGENPGNESKEFNNQGFHNTCASIAGISRQADKLTIGTNCQTAADVVTKGEFKAVDSKGSEFICKVDLASLRPDNEAKNLYAALHEQLKANGDFTPIDARDAYNQVSDIRNAQLNLDIKSRNMGKKEFTYVYKQEQPTSLRDTGERVYNMRTNKLIAQGPLLDGSGISATKQSLFGRFISPTFGKDTTIVSANAFEADPHSGDVTAVRGGADMDRHCGKLAKKHWDLPGVGTHVGNYKEGAAKLGGAEGWHMTSLGFNNNGGYDFINNWGGQYSYTGNNAIGGDKLFSWMHAPKGASEADRSRADHIFNPDGILVKDGFNPLKNVPDKLSQQEPGLKDKPETKAKSEEEKLLQDLRRRRRESELVEAKQKEELNKAIKTRLAEWEREITVSLV